MKYDLAEGKTGLGRSDNRRDMVTQSICLIREIKNPNHPFIICYHLLKCHTAKWFSGLHIHINFHSPKLHVVKALNRGFGN